MSQARDVIKYGITWKPLGSGRHSITMPDISIERAILKDYDKWSKAKGAEVMEWKEHFKLFVTLLWGRPDCKEPFHWNPYSLRMLDGAIEQKMLALSGHASSGKTRFGVVWGLAQFLIYNETTKVFFTSTTIKEARARIWGDVEMYWHEAAKYMGYAGMPGKLVSSESKIVGYINGKPTDKTGCALIASGDSAKDSASKIGFKMIRLLLIADELPLMRHELYEATVNLMVNEGFQMIGIGNLTDVFDPFGCFAEPKDGWDSITEDYDEWPTAKGGYCLRFNGEKSPNVRAGRNLYPGLLTQEGIDVIIRTHGHRTVGYYKMVLSYPCPEGNAEQIYNSIELINNKCHDSNVLWQDIPQRVGFLDPAFTKGGDRAAACICEIGNAYVDEGRRTVQVLKMLLLEDLMMNVSAGKNVQDPNQQLADAFIKLCEQYRVPLNNRGADVTGGGSPFASLLATKQGHGMVLVSFAGKASEKAISKTDTRTGDQRFANRVSELWYIGKEFIRSEQIRGLTKELMDELCTRKYKELGTKILVESKKELKKRSQNKSCDFGDAWAGCVEIARSRFGFMPLNTAKIIPAVTNRLTEMDILLGRGQPTRPTLSDAFQGSVFSGEGSGWGEM